MVAEKKALELLWKGTCDVFIQAEVTDPVTKRTAFQPQLLHNDQRCKLSFESLKTTMENSHAAEVVQSTKLFISNEITIPPGSKIVVTQNGKTAEFEMSGEPGFFTYHQEVPLQIFKGWA